MSARYLQPSYTSDIVKVSCFNILSVIKLILHISMILSAWIIVVNGIKDHAKVYKETEEGRTFECMNCNIQKKK